MPILYDPSDMKFPDYQIILIQFGFPIQYRPFTNNNLQQLQAQYFLFLFI